MIIVDLLKGASRRHPGSNAGRGVGKPGFPPFLLYTATVSSPSRHRGAHLPPWRRWTPRARAPAQWAAVNRPWSPVARRWLSNRPAPR